LSHLLQHFLNYPLNNSDFVRMTETDYDAITPVGMVDATLFPFPFPPKNIWEYQAFLGYASQRPEKMRQFPEAWKEAQERVKKIGDTWTPTALPQGFTVDRVSEEYPWSMAEQSGPHLVNSYELVYMLNYQHRLKYEEALEESVADFLRTRGKEGMEKTISEGGTEEADKGESTESEAVRAGTTIGGTDIGRETGVWTQQDLQQIRETEGAETWNEESSDGGRTEDGSQILSTINNNGEARVKLPESLRRTVKSVTVDFA